MISEDQSVQKPLLKQSSRINMRFVRKRLLEKKKGTNWVDDTRLPYTSYLWLRFQWVKSVFTNSPLQHIEIHRWYRCTYRSVDRWSGRLRATSPYRSSKIRPASAGRNHSPALVDPWRVIYCSNLRHTSPHTTPKRYHPYPLASKLATGEQYLHLSFPLIVLPQLASSWLISSPHG